MAGQDQVNLEKMLNAIQPCTLFSDAIPLSWGRYDPAFAGVNGDEWIERLFTGGRWLEGPTYFPRGPLPGVQRHPEQPNASLGRVQRRRGGLPLAVELRERPHPRPRGPPGQLRAERPAGHPDRTSRDGDRARRPDRREAIQQSERRGRALRRLPVVHRPSYGITSDYEGVRAEQEVEGCHVYRLDPRSGEVRVVADDSRPAQRPGVLGGRVPALHRRHPGEAHPRVRRRRGHGERWQGRDGVQRRLVRRHALRRERPAGRGPRRTTACTASTPRAICSGSSGFRRSCRTCAGVGSGSTTSSSPRPAPSTRSA